MHNQKHHYWVAHYIHAHIAAKMFCSCMSLPKELNVKTILIYTGKRGLSTSGEQTHRWLKKCYKVQCHRPHNSLKKTLKPHVLSLFVMQLAFRIHSDKGLIVWTRNDWYGLKCGILQRTFLNHAVAFFFTGCCLICTLVRTYCYSFWFCRKKNDVAGISCKQCVTFCSHRRPNYSSFWLLFPPSFL
jgi:hypothetical protein